jgi:hypothetical protein
MLAKVFATWLVVLAFLPFTAPFTSCGPGDVFGSRPLRRCSLDVATLGVDAEADATPSISDPASAYVRPVPQWRGDTRLMRLMLVVLPNTGATSSIVGRGRGRLVVPDERYVSDSARPPTILRL